MGPYAFIDHAVKERALTALTIIASSTGLFETCRTRNATLEASQLFDVNWLCRCPKPRKVICDQVSDFKLEFKELCGTYDIKRVPSYRRNPQSNEIIERMNPSLLNMLRVLE